MPDYYSAASLKETPRRHHQQQLPSFIDKPKTYHCFSHPDTPYARKTPSSSNALNNITESNEDHYAPSAPRSPSKSCGQSHLPQFTFRGSVVQRYLDERQGDVGNSSSLEQMIHQYQNQPKMLELILSSKAEEDRRRTEEAKLRQRELDYLLNLKRATDSLPNPLKPNRELDPEPTANYPSWRTLPMPAITIQGILTQHQHQTERTSGPNHSSTTAEDKMMTAAATAALDSFGSKSKRGIPSPSPRSCLGHRDSTASSRSMPETNPYFCLLEEDDTGGEMAGRQGAEPRGNACSSKDRRTTLSDETDRFTSDSSVSFLLSPSSSCSRAENNAVPNDAVRILHPSSDQNGDTRLDMALKFNLDGDSRLPSISCTSSGSHDAETTPSPLMTPTECKPTHTNGPIWAQRQRRRQRRKMQAITMIIETREFPYNDKYLWKNNGNTVHKRSGLRSIYYKCSNSTKGCLVNKTVTIKGNGEYLIKYRGDHLDECKMVKRIVDI
ncbi:hypothetical protein EC973_007448 [Apophysomyces ossiformis]|uniref:WRKY domain-containing protein n=1 Tax=Apophysomyces ossiformis TaxID=679940 RepID=A0A8H7ERM1_9FUNG|nr:hypothetical protein EC973_007448 [Apophysomyces ossiformis]